MNSISQFVKKTSVFLLIFIGVSSLAQPTISSFNPTSGAVGTSVTISGTNFNATLANNVVYFGAVKATVTSANTTSLTVTVPSGATNQPLTVLNTATGLYGSSAVSFAVTFSGLINLSSLNTKVDFTTGTNPYGTAIGDIDGDGKADLIVANYSSNTISIFRNTASVYTVTNSSFTSKVDFTTGTNPYALTLGDVDGDGKLDIIVANYTSSTVSVFRNTATSGSLNSGSLAAKVDFTVGTNPQFVAIGDLDGDGKRDLAVANYTSNTVSVLRNTASSGSITSGSFASNVDFTTGTNPYSVAIGDLDGDGKLDLAIANYSSATLSVLRNTSTSGSITSGSFASKVDFGTGVNPYSVAIGDLDGDGKQDLAVSNTNGNSISVLRNISSSGSISSGSFASKVDFTTGSSPYNLSIADLDGDGKQDLAVVNNSSNTLSVLRNTATSGSITSGSFATKIDYNTGTSPVGIAIGDLDSDGKIDVAVTNSNNNSVSVLRNNQVQTITSFSPTSGVVGTSVTITGTNFNLTASNNIVFFGSAKAIATSVNATGTSLTVTVPVGSTYQPLIVFDSVTGLVALSNLPFATTYTGLANGTTINNGVSFSSGGNTYGIAVGDLDGDGKIDVVLGNQGGSTNTVSVLRNTASSGSVTSGSFATRVDYTVGTTPQQIAIADIDGDGKPEIIAANSGTGVNTISILKNTTTSGNFTSGSFATKVDFATGTSPVHLVTGDIDNDGKQDIVVANSGTNTISVFRNTSTLGVINSNSLAAKVDFTTSGNAYAVAIGDIDGDGKVDLAVSSFAASVSLFRNISVPGVINSSSFAAKYDFANYGTGNLGIILTDIDGDSKLDMAVTNTGGNVLSLFRNTATLGAAFGSGTFAARVDFTTPYANYMLTAGDLDGDGKPEILVGSGYATIALFKNSASSGTINTSSITRYDYTGGGSLRYSAIADIDGDGKQDFITSGGAGNNAQVFRNNPVPTVSSFLPSSGYPSATITITGTNFTNATGVTFGGTAAASFTVVNDTTITAVVGTGASGVIGVTTPCGSASSASSFVFVSSVQTPTISSFTPTLGTVGSLVTITGTNFTGTTNVTFGGIAASNLVVNASTIIATVSNGTTGTIAVTNSAGTATSGGTFTYYDTPTITSFSPSSGAIGSSVTILGTNFDATTTNNIVYFGAVKATVTAASSTSLTVTVPTGATIQPITVLNTISGLQAATTTPFVITFSGLISANSFAAKADMNASATPFAIAGGDFDGDGKIDFTSTQSSWSAFMYRNIASSGALSSASFNSAVGFSAGNGVVAVGDLDGDGKLDLVVQDSNGVLAVLRNTATSGNFSASSFASRVTFATISNSTGIAIGDVDGDGKPDIVVSSTGYYSVFKNASNIGSITSSSFATRVDYTTLGTTGGIAIGDLDGDGKQDVVVANQANNSVSIFRNTTTKGSITSGSFATKVDFTSGNAPRSPIVVDLDGDGKLDIVLVNQNSNTISLLRNTATSGSITSGSFASKVDFTTGSNPYNLGIADFDGDGKPDVMVNNFSSNSTSVYKNTATSGAAFTSGSLASKFDFATANGPTALLVADMDGDGKPDVITVNGSNTFSFFRNNPNPTITSFTPTTGNAATTVTVTGTNFSGATGVSFGGTVASSFTVVNDTTITAVVASGASGSITVTTPVGVATSSANFTFVSSILSPTISSFTPTSAGTGATLTITGTNFAGVTSVTIGGTPVLSYSINPTTIVAIVGGGTTGTIAITNASGTATSSGTFTFYSAPTITSFTPVTGTIGSSVTLSGTNFDATPSNNIVYFGSVKATVTGASSTSLTVTVPSGISSQPITVLNTTSNLQASSSSPFSYSFTGLVSTNSLAAKVDFTTGNSPQYLAIGDIDGDGKSDLVSSNLGASSISVLRNTATSGTISSGSFASKVDFTTGTNPNGIAIGDIDNDGKLDVVVLNNGSFTVSVFRNIATSGSISSGSFATRVDFPTASYPTNVTLADLDQDGKLEIIISNNTSSSISVLRNTSTVGVLNFDTKIDFTTGSSPNYIAVGDIDGDGKLDLAVTNLGSNTVSVFRNTSSRGSITSSSLASKVDFSTNVSPNGVVLTDLDGDGKLDMAVSTQGSSSALIYRNTATSGAITSGSFASSVNFSAVSGSKNIGAIDMNGDGKLDLITAAANATVLGVFRNTASSGTITSGSFASNVSYTTASSPSAVVLGDLDGDGKPDIASINFGVSSISVLRNSPNPSITSFNPAYSNAAGTITITGLNFTGATSVSFGGVAASSFNVVSDTSITAVVGSGANGYVTVTTPVGTATSSTVFNFCDSTNGGNVTGGGVTVCTGNNNTQLTLSGYVGSIQWQISTTSSTTGFSDITGANAATFNALNLTSATYYRAAVTNGSCPTNYSNAVTMNIGPTSVSGTISPSSTTVCTGTNSTLLTLTGYTGSIQWQSSTTSSTSGFNDIVGATGNTFTATNLTTTTYYRVVVSYSSCPQAISSAVMVAVSPTSVAGSVTQNQESNAILRQKNNLKLYHENSLQKTQSKP